MRSRDQQWLSFTRAAPLLQRGHSVQPSMLERAAHISTSPTPAAPSTACIGLAARPGLLR